MRIGDLVAERKLVQPVTILGLVEDHDAYILPEGYPVIIGAVEASSDRTLVGEVAAGNAVVNLSVAARHVHIVLHDRRVLVEYRVNPVRSLSQ